MSVCERVHVNVCVSVCVSVCERVRERACACVSSEVMIIFRDTLKYLQMELYDVWNLL